MAWAICSPAAGSRWASVQTESGMRANGVVLANGLVLANGRVGVGLIGALELEQDRVDVQTGIMKIRVLEHRAHDPGIVLLQAPGGCPLVTLRPQAEHRCFQFGSRFRHRSMKERC